MSDLARKFATIFAGLDRVYGWYAVPNGSTADDHGKVTGRRATVTAPVTLELWQRHLEGKDGFGIGIVPIRDDATCVFGAIDVDVYPVDHKEIIANIRRLGLPLTPGRSKSGGAHLWLFLSEPARAELVMERLREWATLLGYPQAEVFPKQARLAGPEDTVEDRSKGSWINVPYNGRHSTRYVFKDDVTAMTAVEFVAHVEQVAISADDLEEFRPTVGLDAGDWLEEAPPCIQTLGVIGFGDWQNNGLYNIAVYLKKRYGNCDALGEYNRRFMNPMVTEAEVRQIAKSVGKRKYSYKCKDQPICAVCNRTACLTRKFGISGAANDPGVAFGDLIKLLTDPPTWILEVNAKRIHLSTRQLMNQVMMKEVLMAELDVVLSMIPALNWDEMLKEKLAKVVRVEVPTDATPSGQLLVHLQRFCTSRVVGKHLDDLLRGLPFTDEKKGRTFFCSSDFLSYLQTHRVNGIDEKELYTILRPRDLETHIEKVKGKTLTFWSVPAFEKQTEEHTIPHVQSPERM